MNKRVGMLLVIVLGLIFFLGLLIGTFLPRLLGTTGGPRMQSTSAVIQQVKTLSELVTVKYVIEKVVILEDVKYVAVLGESRVLMVAHGVVKAGIDMGKLQPADIKLSGKKVVIRLPAAQITDAYLDENQTRIIERTTGLLRAFDKDLEQTARQNAVDDIRRAARTGGILKDAEDRAHVQLRSLFHDLGYEEVEFKR
jgi:hypothetical protein